MKAKEARKLLADIGYPIKPNAGPVQTRIAIRRFQRGFAFYKHTTGFNRPRTTGVLTKRTAQALAYSASHEGRCSPHFRFAEFATPDTGKFWIHYTVVRGLERLRRKVGRPLRIVSACRSLKWNDYVGGALRSQHKRGLAVDIPDDYVSYEDAREMDEWSGIGLDGGTKWPRHLDKRHRGIWAFGATPARPTVWNY